jgi:predicted ATP-grasp superfamily ATP-dependent carboligase
VIDKILEKVVTWAETEDVIRVIIIEGSRARHDHSVDQFSEFILGNRPV